MSITRRKEAEYIISFNDPRRRDKLRTTNLANL